MKPSVSASALIGAMLVAGGWVSLHTVAFSGQDLAGAPRPRSSVADTCADDHAHQDSANGHVHSSACGCARCTAARND
jgi:hypothetical protein